MYNIHIHMEFVNINAILNRNEIYNNIKDFLINFEENKYNMSCKRGIYIYGNPGTGKTFFIQNLLKELNYDIVTYDAGDIRNKSIVDTITKHNMSDRNVLSMFTKNVKKIVIIMDEIDGMNNGDKGGINSLIKLIRPKKTKKQKLEDIVMNPIICIGNYHIDKKIKELIKVCSCYELKNPTNDQIEKLINSYISNVTPELKSNLLHYIQGDLRKMECIVNIYNKQNTLLKNEIIQNIFQPKSYNEDSKKITQNLINHNECLNNHNRVMNEADRTIVGLLWHENIIDVLGKFPNEESFPFYNTILDTICFSDYMDRITFQKQIWQFNEMTSILKTFYNNKLYHDRFEKKPFFNPSEVRFTKVLTKYSTEYNNHLFIQNLCSILGMDKKDMFAFFQNLRNEKTDEEIQLYMENYDINKLDINRIFRYLDKYSTIDNNDDCLDDESIVSKI